MEFRLLGPLEVADRGRQVPVGAGKRRALLAILLLHANEVVAADRLIDELWGERPPATVAKSLHVHVSQLRKELGQGNGSGETIVHTRGSGYVVEVRPDDVDLLRFERLLADGRRAAEADDPRRASDTLSRAIAIWRGAPLADFTYEPFAQREIARLEELRLLALECRIDADLQLGRHGGLVGELDALVNEHPLRERLRGQLMLALYRCGRQAEALDVYRVGRARLVADLGLEPGPALRELEAKILDQSPALDPPPPMERPAPKPRAAEAAEPEAPAAGRLRRLPLAIVLPIVAGAVLLAAVGLAIISETGEEPAAAPPALDLARSSVAAVDPAGGAVRFASPLPGRPTGLAAAGETVWVATVDSSALVGVDLGTRRIIRTVPLSMKPGAVALGEGAIWVVDGQAGRLARVVPGYDTVSYSIPFRRGRSARPPSASAVVADEGVWIADGSKRLTRVDAETREVTAIETGRPLTAAAAGAGAIWAISADPPSLLRVDPATRSVTDTLPLVARGGEEAPNPVAVAAGPNAVWVLNSNTATVTRVDPATQGVSASIPIGVDRVPNGLATDGDRAWVANEDGTLSRIEPGASVAASVWVGESLRRVAATGTRLWVATAALDQDLPGGAG
jgi:DNA-binding SARP family transcriptional activator/DNA-binding beta-propeller fold protein YncE